MSAHIVTAEEARRETRAWLEEKVVVQAEQIAAVLALHTPVDVNQFDPVNGAFVYGDDDEMIVTHRLCEGCTLDATLELLGDCEWSDEADGNVFYPCPTARALGVTA